MLGKVATFVATLQMLRILHVATRTYHGGDTPGNYYRAKDMDFRVMYLEGPDLSQGCGDQECDVMCCSMEF